MFDANVDCNVFSSADSLSVPLETNSIVNLFVMESVIWNMSLFYVHVVQKGTKNYIFAGITTLKNNVVFRM